MENNPYIVYVKTNAHGYITSINSSEFLNNISGWIEIDSGYGDKYYHAQSHYFSKRIRTDRGAYRYKLLDGAPVECTAKEIEAQEAANKSSYQPPQSLYVTWEDLDKAYYEGVESL